jgi:steroid delta-isomerase-like uncharacterized protein
MSIAETETIANLFMNDYLNSRNPALIDKLFSDDYVNHFLPPGAPNGREGEKMLLGMFLQGFPDFHMTPDEYVVEEGKVAIRYTFEGTNTGSFQGIPPTGKRVKVSGMNILHIANGKIMENFVVLDQMGLMQQLGLMPAPGQ